MLNLQLLPQEQSTKARFAGPVYATVGFRRKFGADAMAIAWKTLVEIGERVGSEEGADYLQIAECQGNRFWILDSDTYVTFLLPEEY